MSDLYNPNQIVGDGPYTCSRKWHHFFNVLLGTFVYAVAEALRAGLSHRFDWRVLAVAPLPCLIGGPGTFIVSRVKEWIWPTDPNPHTLGEHVDDAMTDGACYSAGPVALFLVSVGNWPLAMVATAMLFVAYRETRAGARP